ILTLRDWMEPALRARIGHFTPGEKREFFTEVDYRDPVMMRTHGYHWIDLAWMEHEPNPSPVRREPLLYNIFNTRTEGFATAMEELMLHEGLFDERPRSREMIWILVAQRAARVAEARRPDRLGRAAPVLASARVRDELSGGKDAGGRAHRGPRAGARQPLHDAAFHGRAERDGTHPHHPRRARAHDPVTSHSPAAMTARPRASSQTSRSPRSAAP